MEATLAQGARHTLPRPPLDEFRMLTGIRRAPGAAHCWRLDSSADDRRSPSTGPLGCSGVGASPRASARVTIAPRSGDPCRRASRPPPIRGTTCAWARWPSLPTTATRWSRDGDDRQPGASHRGARAVRRSARAARGGGDARHVVWSAVRGDLPADVDGARGDLPPRRRAAPGAGGRRPRAGPRDVPQGPSDGGVGAARRRPCRRTASSWSPTSTGSSRRRMPASCATAAWSALLWSRAALGRGGALGSPAGRAAADRR